MKILFIFFLALLLGNCSKPTTVFVCGDHVCVNKLEAKQYFEQNLSLEVKIIDPKDKKEISLVELNLQENKKGKKKIRVSSKKSIDQNLKVLSRDEIKKIKKNLKNKKDDKKIVNKINNKSIKQKKIKNLKKEKIVKKTIDNKKLAKKKKEKLKINKNKAKVIKNEINDVIDVCTILEKCSIDEISKYLLDQGKRKKFPDITMRQ